MKLENKAPNYCATVVRIPALQDLEGLDNLKGVAFFGGQALVSKDYEVGTIGVVFMAETQLSKDFCHNNNLYRHHEFNKVKDPEKTGYLEDNRRVKALKLRGNVSTAFFLKMECLEYLGIDTSTLNVGDTFTHINGQEICKKYVVRHRHEGMGNKTKGKTKKFTRITNRTFPEHWDTDNYWRNIDKFKDDDQVIVTQKLHGTSARFTHQLLQNKKPWYHHPLLWLGFDVRSEEWDTVCGTRRVIKDLGSHNSYYETDVWAKHLHEINDIIPQQYVLYGEIIGWAGDKAIQKSYTYGLPQGQSDLYIYRITIVNFNGFVFDMPWDQVKRFCDSYGLKYAPELWRGPHKEFNSDLWIDIRFSESGYPHAVPLVKEGIVDEGVCVRKEGWQPYVAKAKSPKFLLHETKMLDTGAVDTESEQGV